MRSHLQGYIFYMAQFENLITHSKAKAVNIFTSLAVDVELRAWLHSFLKSKLAWPLLKLRS